LGAQRRQRDGDIIEFTISGKTPEMGSSLNSQVLVS